MWGRAGGPVGGGWEEPSPQVNRCSWHSFRVYNQTQLLAERVPPLMTKNNASVCCVSGCILSYQPTFTGSASLLTDLQQL